MLEIKNLHVYYGAIHALKGLSLKVDSGEIVAVLGANGAGKSSLLKAITGVVKVREGEVKFANKVANKIATYQRVCEGISLVPEGRGIFPNLTVEENLIIGGYIHRKEKANVQKLLGEMLEEFPRLKERINQKAGTLSGGEQQMLAVARGLMSSPKVLLLDEPSMGLSPIMVSEVFKLIGKARDKGITILLVEQNANSALKLADRGYVLDMGEIVLSGTAAELAGSDLVRAAYLA